MKISKKMISITLAASMILPSTSVLAKEDIKSQTDIQFIEGLLELDDEINLEQSLNLNNPNVIISEPKTLDEFAESLSEKSGISKSEAGLGVGEKGSLSLKVSGKLDHYTYLFNSDRIYWGL